MTFCFGHLHIQRGAGKGQRWPSVATGLRVLPSAVKQNAVEVVANVLYRHRKTPGPAAASSVFCGTANAGPAQIPAPAESLQRQVCRVKRSCRPSGSGWTAAIPGLTVWSPGMVQDVDQFACAHRGGEVAVVAAQLAAVRIWISRSLIWSTAWFRPFYGAARWSALAACAAARQCLPRTGVPREPCLVLPSGRSVSSTSCGFEDGAWTAAALVTPAVLHSTPFCP